MAGLAGLMGSKAPSLEDEYVDDAYHALRDGDREAFRSAFKKAVQACVKKNDAGEYDEPDGDDAEA